MGGPIKQDKVWFYAVTRTLGAYTDIAGRFANANAGDATQWNYVADPQHHVADRQQPEDRRRRGVTARLRRGTRSASTSTTRRLPRQRVHQDAERCRARGDDWVAVGGFGTWSPEATTVADERREDHAVRLHRRR